VSERRGRSGADPAQEGDRSTHGAREGAWEQIRTLVFAVLIALAIRAFVIEPFRIPSGSMFPTLLIGDHLFVNKFVYGIRIPFTDVRLPGLREPRRGDVIVFTVAKDGIHTYPADRRPDLPSEEFVKRIVGIPGDRIDFRNGVVTVNGEPQPMEDLGSVFRDPDGNEFAVRQVVLEDRRYQILDAPGYTPSFAHGASLPTTVEPGRYFVLGDNRDHSKDSRAWGSVRETEIKGPAFVLYWSWDYNGGWLQLLDPRTLWTLFTQKMRWSRIGDLVH
jgi:signal peptidase I